MASGGGVRSVSGIRASTCQDITQGEREREQEREKREERERRERRPQSPNVRAVRSRRRAREEDAARTPASVSEHEQRHRGGTSLADTGFGLRIRSQSSDSALGLGI
eukprot:3548366-Rhodomonas_salina.1